jgi:hypothetical protein
LCLSSSKPYWKAKKGPDYYYLQLRQGIFDLLQHQTKTLQLTETGTVATAVKFGPGTKLAAICRASAPTTIKETTKQTPSWQASASIASTDPFAAPVVPTGTPVILVT